MAPRGKRFKSGKEQHRKSNPKGKSYKSKGKQRKTYSLYGSNNNHKRKPEIIINPDQEKRLKVEEKPQIAVESSSDSELEVEDHIKQLRETFKTPSTKRSLAIDSSEDSSEDDDLKETMNTDQNETESESDTDFSDFNTDNDLSDDEQSISNSKVDDDIKTQKIDEIKPDNEDEPDEIVDENEIDADLQNEDKDPFAQHLFYELNESLLNSVQNVPQVVNSFVENWNILGRLIIQIPQCEEAKIIAPKVGIEEEKKFARSGTVPRVNEINKNTMSDLCIKIQITNNLIKTNKGTFSALQNEMFSIINNYQDFYFPQRTFDNANEIRFIYCLHVVNHILKTRMKILHHNARLSKKGDVPDEFRDQGLVRPKILIIVPFRDSAYKIIQTLIDILITEDKGNVINKNRFVEDYTGNEIFMPKKNPKPEDYEQTFCGNCNDDFKIGITVTKKSLKLYADFYSSDIIIASPLGLRFTIGAEGEAERDYDFLASIELLIMDQTEIFLMQNWDHLLHVLKHIHLQPKDSHGTDFSRVRTWSLNGWSRYYRQTLLFSSVTLPEINAIFNKKCFNYVGKVKVANVIEDGSIGQVFVQLPHVFYKFSAGNVAEAIDERFNLFLSKILPQQRDTLMKQTMIFVANYFDYVRLRNYFKREDISFVQICEYSKDGKVARARDMFYHGDAHFVLYTERYHFFHRIRVKGIRHIVFYQLPSFPHFYYEICNLMREANMNRKVGSMSNMTVTVLYSKYDTQQLAAIVGTEKAAKMLQSERNVHMMVTGE